MDQKELNEKRMRLMGDLEALELQLQDWMEEAFNHLELDDESEYLRENLLSLNLFLKRQGYDV